MKEEILKLIEKSKKDYDKKTQRAELLKRNKNFLNKLEGIKTRLGNEFYKVKDVNVNKLKEISNDNILLKLDYPKANISISEEPLEEVEQAYSIYTFEGKFDGYNPRAEIKDDSYFKNSPDLDTVIVYYKDLNSLQTKIISKFQVLRAYIEKWIEFCTKWHIHPDWNGNFDTLGKFQRSLIEIIVGSPRQIDFCNSLPIIIKIGPWTTLEDIKEIWSKIERIQKIKFYKEEKRSNFARDLCWFDLNKKFNLGLRQIAELWIANYPEDIDLLVLRRMKKEIDKQGLEGRVLDESELINEVKSGILSKKYKNRFETEKKYYLTGQTDRGKKTPPFIEVIKKAIKNFEKRIHVLDLPSENRVIRP